MGIFNFFKPRQVSCPPQKEDQVDSETLQAKANLKKNLVNVFKITDVIVPQPTPDQIERAIRLMIEYIPVSLKQSIKIGIDHVFVKFGDINIGITEEVYKKYVRTELVKSIKALGITVTDDGNNIYMKVNELRKYCRYDKVKSMV